MDSVEDGVTDSEDSKDADLLGNDNKENTENKRPIVEDFMCGEYNLKQKIEIL